MLIKQPVKEAVREALAEDRADARERTRSEEATNREMSSSSAADSDSSGTLRRLLFLAVAAGAAYYALQRRGIDIEDELTEDVGFGESDGPSGSSVDDPLSPDHESGDDSMSGGETDEGPTTRS